MRTVVYDTEFIEDWRTIDLISIGMIDSDGRELYAVNREAPWKRIARNDWLTANVARYLPRLHGDARLFAGRRNPLGLDFSAMMPRTEIRDAVPVDELWADYGAYDHVALAQLFGTMMDLPDGVPMFTHELMQLWEDAGRPEKPVQMREHNALDDARHGLAIWRLCQERVR